MTFTVTYRSTEMYKNCVTTHKNSSFKYILGNKSGHNTAACKSFLFTLLEFNHTNDPRLEPERKYIVKGKISPKLDQRRRLPDKNKIDRNFVRAHTQTYT